MIRSTLIPLAAAFLMSAASFALAQDKTGPRHAPAETAAGDWRQFTIESELALSKMSLAMTADPTGDVDRDFVAMMMPHHQGAIDIARAELKYGQNEELRRLARDIIVEQEREMLVMRGVAGKATSLRRRKERRSTRQAGETAKIEPQTHIEKAP